MCSSGSGGPLYICLHHQRSQVQSPLLPRLHCFWCGQYWHRSVIFIAPITRHICSCLFAFTLLSELGVRDHFDTRPGLRGGLPACPSGQEERPRIIHPAWELWQQAQQTSPQTSCQHPQICKHCCRTATQLFEGKSILNWCSHFYNPDSAFSW